MRELINDNSLMSGCLVLHWFIIYLGGVFIINLV